MVINELEKNLETAYEQVFYRLLMDGVSSENGVMEYDQITADNRNKIGNVAGKKAAVLAKNFVKEMKNRGFIERKPSEKELEDLMKEFLRKLR